jgi:ketosteroid isomerase-like protein
VVTIQSVGGLKCDIMTQKDLFLRAAAAMSVGDIDHIAEWFTEDFRLHDPGLPNWPTGYEGARRMCQTLLDLVPGARVEVLDMVEEGDRVGVRWLFSGVAEGKPVHLSAVAIYRFVDGRIAEDWGIGFKSEWPPTA